MIAMIGKDREILATAIFKGEGTRILIKSSDLKLRKKLYRLFNSSIDAFEHKTEEFGDVSVINKLIPGTKDHFLYVSFLINLRSPYILSLVSSNAG